MPLQDDTLALVEASRSAIADVLHGRDDRLVVVVGPCSIHDHDQALEYGHQLRAAAEELRGELLIVMRVTSRSRTTVGWKGYINDPHRTAASPSTRGWSARAACCSISPRWACRWAPNSSTCSARSTSPTW